ncbi:MAG TPA: helix-turn-helix transcriptional regulator [Phycisphaerae bacterium]|nr:helix-turn-helix transcriptional regulator [Phycisphaerae bacterium]
MGIGDIKSKVGQKLRELREEMGWSQEELGFKADLHRNYIGGIERGERNVGIENIAKLAKALKVRPRDLLP